MSGSASGGGKRSEKMLDSLKRPEGYDQPPEGEIRMLQTHISWVFLTGKYAYKVKKPVDFGFLDYTTLEKRKGFCKKELEINRKLSGDMYVGVLPINEFGGNVRINGPGEAIDYAVKMKELPQDSLMNNLLDKNLVGTDAMDKIVDMLLGFYSRTETFRDPNSVGSFSTVKFNWKENFKQTSPFIGKTIGRKDFETIRNNVEIFMSEKKPLFDRRLGEGRVKWCHGDLHSGNIFVLPDKICIFDAIEFNERFACSDVAGDLAFLAMDLEHRHKNFLSDYLLKKYVEKSGDSGIRDFMGFYKCYRAYVRGKVTGFKMNDPSVPEDEKKEARDAAQVYFQLALSYAKEL